MRMLFFSFPLLFYIDNAFESGMLFSFHILNLTVIQLEILIPQNLSLIFKSENIIQLTLYIFMTKHVSQKFDRLRFKER